MTWVIPGANYIPLQSMSPGNAGPTLGVIVHVTTDDAGSPAHYFSDPNHQASSMWFIGNGQGGAADGGIEQYGDPDTQHAWAQAAGNWDYHSIEFEGRVDEPMTPAQIISGGHILAEGHIRYGWPLVIADAPGQPGLGVHNMGGAAWGGHTCPGPGPRQAQRADIIAAAQAELVGAPAIPLVPPVPLAPPMTGDNAMQGYLYRRASDGLIVFIAGGVARHQTDMLHVNNLIQQGFGYGPLQTAPGVAAQWYAADDGPFNSTVESFGGLK